MLLLEARIRISYSGVSCCCYFDLEVQKSFFSKAKKSTHLNVLFFLFFFAHVLTRVASESSHCYVLLGEHGHEYSSSLNMVRAKMTSRLQQYPNFRDFEIFFLLDFIDLSATVFSHSTKRRERRPTTR